MEKRFLVWMIFLLIAPGAISQTDIDWKQLHKDLYRLDSCLEVGELTDSLLMVYDSQLMEFKSMVAILEAKNELNENEINRLYNYTAILEDKIIKQNAQIRRQKTQIKILGSVTGASIIIIIISLLL